MEKNYEQLEYSKAHGALEIEKYQYNDRWVCPPRLLGVRVYTYVKNISLPFTAQVQVQMGGLGPHFTPKTQYARSTTSTAHFFLR